MGQGYRRARPARSLPQRAGRSEPVIARRLAERAGPRPAVSSAGRAGAAPASRCAPFGRPTVLCSRLMTHDGEGARGGARGPSSVVRVVRAWLAALALVLASLVAREARADHFEVGDT